jgi:Protein of unknown function, DUF547
MKQSATLFVALVLALAATSGSALSGTEPWDRWQGHDETSMVRVDHGLWENFLLHYLRPGADGIHRIAYGRVTVNDRKALDAYLTSLSEISIADFKRSEQMAYWINLYNALTIELILDHYPIPSIRKLEKPGKGLKQGPWDRTLITIDGVSLSLDDIEKRILKPIWHDQRLQYALSCGALGCPNLQAIPYSGAALEQQLSDAAMAYVNDKRCIVIDGDELRVSSLYRWNIDDFGGSDQGIIHHLMAYAEPDLAMALQKFDHIDGDGFDWRLNDSGG